MEYFDIVIIVPLEEELREVFAVFPSLENRSTATEFLHVVNSGHPEITMLVTLQQEAGKQAATLSAGKVLDKFKAGILVCLGIAGGLSKDMRLGDVCYSGSILDVLDNNKALDNNAGGFDIELSPNWFSTPREITLALNNLRTQPDLTPLYDEWQKQRVAFVNELSSTAPSGHSANDCVNAPRSLNGTIVCGPVSISPAYNKKLQGLDRKILSIETESGGIFSQAREMGASALTIRGISDYADPDKGKLEEKSGGNIRRIAAANAASFLRLQFQNPYFVKAIKAQHKVQVIQTPLALQPNDLPSKLRNLGQTVDEKLRELSPEFRLQPKGYRLPVPRIKQLEAPNGIGKRTEIDPQEIREAIQGKQMVLINLPRTYPDQSLAWVIADDLMTTDVDGKQAFPIVINADLVKPPGSTFEAITQQSLQALAAERGVQPIFIIENTPFNSKTRLKFLIEQIKLFPVAKFVFITRDDTNLIRESEFTTQLSIDSFRVCEISFAEISHFIQKNFSMTGSEADVVAIRLRDTFNRFRLAAHPTYFAGIPRETLSALLQANRRAELIQLAVDGFLTFVVAGDRAGISLSRTTRSRFLRKLVFAMKVEKKSFDQSQVIEFTNAFAKAHDFNIKPIAFIQSFVDNGILHFDREMVRFSLPFIESYLLAIELKDNIEAGVKYFDPTIVDFDLITFDLFAEIGANAAVLAKIIEQLAASKAALKPQDGRKHILLANELSPAMIRDPVRFSDLQSSLRKAAEDIRKDHNDNEKKQKLLDIADQVRETIAKQAREDSKDEKEAEKEEIKRLSAAVQTWAIATTLLGSGAEHLDAQTKRHIASELVYLATMILDEWTRLRMAFDMEAVKNQLTSEENIKSFHLKRSGKPDLDETKKLIVSLVDLLEYHILAQPFFRILGQLCEQARQPVLAMSIENLQIDGEIENLIWNAWLADVEGGRSKNKLKEVLKALPFAPFLRISFAAHCMMRVYWHHWHKEDRLTLLEAAEESIEPISIKLNKDGLMRMIEREDDAGNEGEVDPSACA